MRDAGKLVCATLLVLGVAIPAAADASTHWYYERRPIAEGETVEVASSSSKLEVDFKEPKRPTMKVPCTAGGREAFWNAPAGGRDETRALSFSCSAAPCGAVLVRPLLPWASTLLEGAPPLIDQWQDVALELVCGGTNYGVFHGSLEAKVGDVDPPSAKEDEKDDLDNNLAWRDGPKNPLVAANGDEVWFDGFYRLGGKGTGVSDESGE